MLRPISPALLGFLSQGKRNGGETPQPVEQKSICSNLTLQLLLLFSVCLFICLCAACACVLRVPHIQRCLFLSFLPCIYFPHFSRRVSSVAEKKFIPVVETMFVSLFPCSLLFSLFNLLFSLCKKAPANWNRYSLQQLYSCRVFGGCDSI